MDKNITTWLDESSTGHGICTLGSTYVAFHYFLYVSTDLVDPGVNTDFLQEFSPCNNLAV
jgi:hypothetical protein